MTLQSTAALSLSHWATLSPLNQTQFAFSNCKAENCLRAARLMIERLERFSVASESDVCTDDFTLNKVINFDGNLEFQTAVKLWSFYTEILTRFWLSCQGFFFLISREMPKWRKFLAFLAEIPVKGFCWSVLKGKRRVGDAKLFVCRWLYGCIAWQLKGRKKVTEMGRQGEL